MLLLLDGLKHVDSWAVNCPLHTEPIIEMKMELQTWKQIFNVVLLCKGIVSTTGYVAFKNYYPKKASV